MTLMGFYLIHDVWLSTHLAGERLKSTSMGSFTGRNVAKISSGTDTKCG